MLKLTFAVVSALAIVRWCVVAWKGCSAGEGGQVASNEPSNDISRTTSIGSVADIKPEDSKASLSSEDVERVEDVPSETEEVPKSTPAASWGPASPNTKLPTPVRPATIFCEMGSHHQVYGAGYMSLNSLFAMFFYTFKVAALPSGTVWGDVIAYSLNKVETPDRHFVYHLTPVAHYWVDDCPEALSTYEDIVRAMKEADDYF